MKVISYNTLAKRYIEPESYWNRYPHIKNHEIRLWDYRLPIIIKLISEENADLILLQEIELESFEKDFAPLFAKYSFWKHEYSKKVRNNPIGNVILWKNNVVPIKQTTTSCSLIVEFDNFWVINVHLKAGIVSGEDIRLNQIKSVLKNVNYDKPGFMAGDFNDILDSPCLYNVTIKRLVAKELARLQIHSYLNSCYVHNREYNTDNYWTFDHVVSNRLQITISAHTDNDSKPIPNESEPSDHLMMVFEIAEPHEI